MRQQSANMKKTKGIRRFLYEKACACFGIVPVGQEGGFQPFARPARDIPYFISLNPKVNPYNKIPNAILKAHIRIISHFLTRKIEKRYFQGVPLEADLPDYLQVRDRLDYLRRTTTTFHKQHDLKALDDINRLYEGFLAKGEITVTPPHKPFDEKTMHILDTVIASRRSVRCWKSDPVPRETIRRAIESAVWAPSTGNFQAVRYIVIDDAEVKARINVGGFAGRSVPVILAVCVDVRVYPSASIGNRSLDAAAAIQNFLLKAHALGLGAVWIAGRSVNAEGIRQLLGLPEYVENISFVYLGWPANTPVTPPRVDVSEVTCYNRFDEASCS
jgi:nitroreductase